MSGWINALLTITGLALAMRGGAGPHAAAADVLTVTMGAYPHTYSKAPVMADNARGNTLLTC